jgi:PAS domain S-box-containing protein
MIDLDLDSVDADGRALIAADGSLRVLFANRAAVERFPPGRLPGLSLDALFGTAGTPDGLIGRAVLAGERAVAFLPSGEEHDCVRADMTPLENGVTLIALDREAGGGDAPYRERMRALTSLVAGFRGASDASETAAVAEAIASDWLGARARYLPLSSPLPTSSASGGGDRRGPRRRHAGLAVPAAVRQGEVIAVDGPDAPPAAGLAEAEPMQARGVAAFMWVPLVRDGHAAAAMLLEADIPRRWTGCDVGLVQSIMDRTDLVSARLDAAAEIAHAEERCRVLVDTAAAAVWEAEADGNVAEPSPSWCELTGQCASEMLGSGWIEAVHPADRAAVRTAWERSVAAAAPFDVEARLVDLPRAVRLKATPLLDGRGVVKVWVGMAIDISAAKAAEADRQAGEQRLTTLLEGIPQLVWRAGPSGERTWSSPQWCRATGQTPDDSLGSGWLDAVHPEDRPGTLAAWESAEANAPLHVDHRLFDGTAWRWFQTRATAVTDPAGAVVEWLGTSTDVHDLRRLEEDQRHFVAELQHRTRNLIAVVQSVVRHSIPRAASPEAFADALEGRLKSLSRVQGVLSRGPRHQIMLGDLVAMELHALPGGAPAHRVSMRGTDVEIRRSAVQLLTLALHELSENARLHGALSDSTGTLSVDWTKAGREGFEVVDIVWRERFGSARSVADVDRGYGRTLVENALSYSLGATVSLALHPAGLDCAIQLPLRDARAAGVP